jgi:aminomuconate-semialdehyde/2-hydroxymuconate-6-semialdehyde dehydrogenase
MNLSGVIAVPEELRAWLRCEKRLFIGGEWREGFRGRVFSTENPATEEELSKICIADKEDVNLAVQSARDAFDSGAWSGISQKERAGFLRKIGDVILEHRFPLALLESLDTGKPLRESYEGDIPRAAANFHFFAEFGVNPEEKIFESNGDTHRAFREPLGVVALITPWNLPLYLETWKIAPALLMGNSIVLKPSELTPLTSIYFTELLEKLNLPKGVFQLIQGFGEKEAGEFLVSHPGIDAISFTGETSTGQAIMRSAANGPTRVSFELGGKGASVVFADSDLDNAISETLRAGFRNQGQICLASPRIFLERKIAAEFTERYVERVKKIQVGDPLDMKTDMGALISREHREKVESFLKRVEDRKCFLTGGGRPAGLKRGFYLEPTVLKGVSLEHPVSREEIFGPVVALYSFETEKEVIQWVNDTPYGLSASIYSRNLELAETVARRLRSGLVWINCWFARDLRVPFGGQKRSGVGREGGTHSLDFFSEWKSVCIRGGK